MDLYRKIQIKWHPWSIKGNTSSKMLNSTYGIEYEETFAPMTKINIVQISIITLL
jgi:hypothetical protein